MYYSLALAPSTVLHHIVLHALNPVHIVLLSIGLKIVLLCRDADVNVQKSAFSIR